MPELIPEIDRQRRRYERAISEAMLAAEELKMLDAEFRALLYVPTTKAIDEIEAVANSVIARHTTNIKQPVTGPVYNVGGDVIQVGDIIDAENIAIGKDIDQDVNEPPARRYRPPGRRDQQ